MHNTKVLFFEGDKIVGTMPYPNDNPYFPTTPEGTIAPPVTLNGIVYELLGTRDVVRREPGETYVNVRRK